MSVSGACVLRSCGAEVTTTAHARGTADVADHAYYNVLRLTRYSDVKICARDLNDFLKSKRPRTLVLRENAL